ncbi:MAG TPA: hypothetical protein VFL86_20165, partial [Burkholderiaceae bacterium]|nr:hypothetical protein [Burkholderiaceae bacterium]
AAAPDIGRQINPTQRELFVSCDPAEAMQQQFDHLQPEFIALHDIGTQSSRKLLAGVAAASGRSVQKLVIRRQGYGTPLATLEFIDFPAGRQSLRIYTTEADADTHGRQELARVLLSYSRLGVVMVGDLPPHMVQGAFEPLHEAMIRNNWHNRHLLLLPLATSSALSSLGTDLSRGTGVNVRTTPQVTRPADAWSFISGTWNRLRESIHTDSGQGLPALPGASGRAPGASAAPVTAPAPLTAPPPASPPPATAPLAMKPMPTVRSAEPRTADSPLARYVNQLIELTGMVSVAIFDVATGRPVLHAGARPTAEELGQHGATLLAAMVQTSRTLGLGHTLPEAAITLGTHHLLLRAVPHHPGMALHAVLDKTHANLTLARLQILRMDAVLEG